MTGIAIALTIPAAGALLVSTIMVLPASIAMRLGKNFKSVILIGVIVGFYWYGGWYYHVLLLGNTCECNHYGYFCGNFPFGEFI